MTSSRLTVAWIADFPIEWMPDLPEPLRHLPRQHPATWQRVLLAEFERDPTLRVHVVVLRKRIEKGVSFERNGVMFHILKTPGGLRAPSLFWVDTLLIRRVLRRIHPDLVHAWGTERGAALIASRLGYPYVATIQGLLTWYRQLVPFGAYDNLAAFLERLSLRRAAVATTESTFAAEFLRQHYPRLKVHQAEHAPNRLFHHVERRPRTKPVRFISVGTLDYRKGTDLLFRALDQLAADLEYDLVSISGGNRQFLKPLQAELSPKLWRRTQFKSDLEPVDVARELAEATMMILPTRADTSPNAVKEAVVAGVPVVASAIGGIVDYVFPGQNGWLFPPGNLYECVNAIRGACRHPHLGQGEVDLATLSRARDYLSPERMARRFLEAYQLAEGKRQV